MRLFHNDYNEACHPEVLNKLISNSSYQMNGYGEDECCRRAAELIRQKCNRDDLSVHFFVGGTQANLTIIDAALRPHQAAVGAVTAHINVHETGSIEATGHKVIGLPSNDGKITARQIEETVLNHIHDESHEHIAQPKLVYISNPTELGTIYSLSELEEISLTCKKYGLYLFADGARLGYGLAAEGNDVTLADMARLCDVFYIGGTKVGAMFGEAVVITNEALQEDFRYIIKQKGGMLAKGRLLGVQFLELFKDGLYFEISAHAIRMANILKEGLAKLGYEFYADSKTNQQFVIVPNQRLDEIKEKYGYEYQMPYDETSSVVRFCTSWATKEEHVLALLEDMK